MHAQTTDPSGDIPALAHPRLIRPPRAARGQRPPSRAGVVIEDDNSVTAELNEPYAILLSPHVIKAAARHHATTAHTATPIVARTTSGTNKPRRPSGRRGLNYEVMVDLAGQLSNLALP